MQGRRSGITRQGSYSLAFPRPRSAMTPDTFSEPLATEALHDDFLVICGAYMPVGFVRATHRSHHFARIQV